MAKPDFKQEYMFQFPWNNTEWRKRIVHDPNDPASTFKNLDPMEQWSIAVEQRHNDPASFETGPFQYKKDPSLPNEDEGNWVDYDPKGYPGLKEKEKWLMRGRAFNDFVTMGLNDEMLAGLKAGLALVPGGKSPSEAYKETMKQQAEYLTQSQMTDPVGTAAAHTAGGVAMMGLGAPMAAAGATLRSALPRTASALGMRGPNWLPSVSTRQVGGHTVRDRVPLMRDKAGQQSPWDIPKGFGGDAASARLRQAPYLRRHLLNPMDRFGPAAGGGIGFASAYHLGSGQGSLEERTEGIGPAAGLGAAIGPLFGAASSVIPGYYRDKAGKLAPLNRAGELIQNRFRPKTENADRFPEDEFGHAAAEIGGEAIKDFGGSRNPYVDPSSIRVPRTSLRYPEETIADYGYNKKLGFGSANIPGHGSALAEKSFRQGGRSEVKVDAARKLEDRALRGEEAVLRPLEAEAGVDVAKRLQGRLESVKKETTPAYRLAYDEPPSIVTQPIRDVILADSNIAKGFAEAAKIRASRIGKSGESLPAGDPFSRYPTVQEVLNGSRLVPKGMKIQEAQVIADKYGYTIIGQHGLGSPAWVRRAGSKNRQATMTAREVHELAQGMQGLAERETGALKSGIESRVTQLKNWGFNKPSQRAADGIAEKKFNIEDAVKKGNDFFTVATFRQAKDSFNNNDKGKKRSDLEKESFKDGAWQHAVALVKSGKTDLTTSDTLRRMKLLFGPDKVGYRNWLGAVRSAERYNIANTRLGKISGFGEGMEGMSVRQKVGSFSKRSAEFAFSVPFAAARSLDRAMTRGKMISEKGNRDAMIQLLTATGPDKVAAEKLIAKELLKSKPGDRFPKDVNAIIRLALGMSPMAEQIDEMPGVGTALKAGTLGALGTANALKGLLGF
tara:strand:+ start:985 stop:3672 length:2688 start_codon:yes stop_codon:yes gene_type:complete